MPATYIRGNNDKAYRLVSLRNDLVPEFMPFKESGEKVMYTEDKILEIQHEDDTTELIYAFRRKRITLREWKNGLMLLSDCPTQRLYIKPNRAETLYKVPDNLPKEGDLFVLYLEGPVSMTLVADRYFSAAYEL